MRALIDGDLLAYECSACGQAKDPETGEMYIKPFDSVSDMMDQRVKEIVAESFSDEEPTLYMTGDEKLLHHVNKARLRRGEEVKVYRPNFRKDVAKTKVYKGNRKAEKPFHFDNIRAYMLSQFNCIVTDGMEADDKICIDQYADYVINKNNPQVVSCSRDKDLRINPGLHFRWACGKQPADGPTTVTELGHLALSQGSPKKLRGDGLKFFYSQLITGDSTDNIPGLPKRGPVFAYNLLNECGTEAECFNAVKQSYEEVFGEAWKEHLREMTDLLWMVREVDEDSSLKFYEWPPFEENINWQDREVKIPDVVENGLKQSTEASSKTN